MTGEHPVPTVALRTVIVFTYECAPYHDERSTIGAQRIAQFAKYLPQFGWRAIVICCDSRARGVGWSDAAASRVRHLVDTAPPDASVIVPTPSLSCDGLIDRWWRASLPQMGLPDYRALWRKPLTAVKQLTRGDYSSAWQPCARYAAEIILQSRKVDACVGEHSPDAGLVLGRWLSARARIPWIADFRDPVLRPFGHVLRTLYLPRIRHIVSTASFVVNVNDHWADLDRKQLRRPTSTIPNGFDPKEFCPNITADRNDACTVTYCGNINPRIQRIEPLFQAFRLLRERATEADTSRIRFVYRGNAAEYVRRLAAELEVTEFVDSEGHLPREQALLLLRRADVLLLLSVTGPALRDKQFSRGLYPGKTFEYFGARRPIMCVPGDDGMLDALIRETRTGVVLRDSSEIADYLDAALTRWKAGQALTYAPNEEVVARFTRRNLTARLASVLDHITSESFASTTR